MTALNVKTGEPAWQKRGFKRSSIVHADGKFIIMDEDGDLALARMKPDGMTVLSRAAIFDTTSWTVPTLVGTTLYARDREKILALDLGRVGQRSTSNHVKPLQYADNDSSSTNDLPPSLLLPTRSDFSGIWELNQESSRVGSNKGLAGLGNGGAPSTLHITQAANNSLLLSSRVNAAQARAYVIGGSSSVPIGQSATMHVTSHWKGSGLVTEGTHVLDDGAVVSVHEVMLLQSKGLVLTIDVLVDDSGAEDSSHLVYEKMVR